MGVPMALIENLPTGVYERDQESKGYYKLLIVGGRGAQSSEINEIQQIQDTQRSRLTESIFTNGSLISGGFLNQDSSGNKTIRFKESKANLQGYIFIIPASEITPNLEGESTVGLKVTKEFVTEKEDTDLLSPVVGTSNYKSSGAYRLKYTVEWSAELGDDVSDENIYYYPIYTTLDGMVLISKSKSSSEIYDTIARYDRDSNGSYIIDGMNMYYSKDSNNYHICGISQGSAHVNGYEVTFSYSVPINIRKALDTYTRISEPFTVVKSETYSVRHTPIAEISRISGSKQITREITHNFQGSSDTLPDTVSKIVSIKQGDTTYTFETDYIVDGDNIDWSPNGKEPATGSTYTVEYQYITTNIDYTISEDRSTINVTGLASGTQFFVDYSHYLQRIDKVVLQSNGSLSIVEGDPSENNPVSQNVSDGLVISSVLVKYATTPYFYNDYYRAVKMSDLVSIKNAIINLQSSLSQLELRTDISSTDPTSTKQGIFVDPFVDNDQRDYGIEQNAEIVDEILYPYRNWQILNVRSGNEVSLPSTEVIQLEQPYRTKSRKINEFITLSSNPVGFISITPSTYRWTADFTEVSQVVYKTYGTHRWHTLQDTKVNNITLTDTISSYPVPVFSLLISGTNFNSKEQVVISIDGINCGTLVTNSSGEFSGTINTPSTMKSGIKQVVATGSTSGCKAITTLSTIPQISTRYVTKYYENDPIGQTFINNELCIISSVDIYFADNPVDYVEVAITETSSGFPDPNKILASKTLQKNQISTDRFTRFTFDSPVTLYADTYYSIIIISPESVGSVYVAELGKRDNQNNVWMSQNVFPSGTLVQASQLYTWSAVQSEDLTFRLVRQKYSTNSSNKILLGEVTIDSNNPVSQLYLLSDSKVYTDTSLGYKIKLDSDNNSEYSISEYSTMQLLNKYSGNIKLYAEMESNNDKVSPLISGDIQLACSSPVYPSTYVSRTFSTDGRYLKVYLDVLEYTVDQISIFYLTNPNENTSDWVWTKLNYDAIKFPPVNLGQGWITKTYYYDIGTSLSTTKIKIQFNDVTSTNINLPGCKNLRVLTNSVSF